jgi:hypothetical protein
MLVGHEVRVNDAVHGSLTIAWIGEVFPMEDLTLGGIKRAVERLTGARVRAR